MKKIKKRKFISFALTAAMMFVLFSGVNFSVSAEIADKTGWTAISDRAGLEAMRNNLYGKYYLTKDIDLSGAEWIPVGSGNYGAFRGAFDGQGYVIRNLKITGKFEYNGLFGYAENASIQNIGLEGININITVDFDVYAGGICGYGDNVEILNSYTAGNISAVGSRSYTGGLTGFFNGTIKNCYTLCNISGSSSASNTSSSGGLVGECGGSLEIANCYATGNVTVSSANSSIYAGGLIGHSQNYDTLITNCYRSSSQSITGGIINQSGTPLTDSEMKQKSFFTGFDFNKVWGIDEGKNSPYLRVFVCNISISSAAERAGKEISVNVEIANNPGIAAYKLIVLYDTSKLEYTGGIDTAIVGAGGLLKIQSINDDITNRRVIVVAVNTNGSDVTDDGLLFTLKFKVKAGTPSGDYTLTLHYEENTDIKNENNTPVNPILTNGNINVVKIIRGDANGDKSVDVGDLICLARHFAQIEFITDDICLEAADANNDGTLSMADLIRLAQHIAEIELLPAE